MGIEKNKFQMPNTKYQILIKILVIGIILLNTLNVFSQNTVKIGVAFPMFSESEDNTKKQLGTEILDGIKFALTEYSKNAPVKVTLEVMDTKRDPVTAKTLR